MLASQLLTVVALSATALAAPSVVTIRADDVILYGQGRYQVMKRTDLDELEAYRKNGTVPPMPGYLNPNLVTFSGKAVTNSTGTEGRSIQKREGSTIVIPSPDSRFIGWDVQMSQVVQGPTTLTVNTGYAVANSITVGASTELGIVKDFLSASYSIDYAQSWTSTQTQLFQSAVPAGKYGAFVSNPWTNRKTGNVFEGRVGSEGTLTSYQADSFDAKGFAEMQWVDGVISLCVKDVFPMPRCLGEGTL